MLLLGILGREEFKLEAAHRFAEGGPGERGVGVDDVAAGAVRDLFEHVSPSAIDATEGDHRATGVVDTARPESEPLEVVEELVSLLVARAHGPLSRWDDEVARGGRATHEPLEAFATPRFENELEGEMDRNHAWGLGLGSVFVGAGDGEARERCRSFIEVTPAKASELTEADTGEKQEGVHDTTILRHSFRREEKLDLVATEDRGCAPVGVLIAELGQLILGEHARRVGEHLIDDEVRTELVEGAVDVPDGTGRERTGAQGIHKVADVPHPELLHGRVAQDRQHMVAEDREVIINRAEAELAAPLDPGGDEVTKRWRRWQRRLRWLVGARSIAYASLDGLENLLRLGLRRARCTRDPAVGLVLEADVVGVAALVDGGHGSLAPLEMRVVLSELKCVLWREKSVWPRSGRGLPGLGSHAVKDLLRSGRDGASVRFCALAAGGCGFATEKVVDVAEPYAKHAPTTPGGKKTESDPLAECFFSDRRVARAIHDGEPRLNGGTRRGSRLRVKYCSKQDRDRLHEFGLFRWRDRTRA